MTDIVEYHAVADGQDWYGTIRVRPSISDRAVTTMIVKDVIRRSGSDEVRVQAWNRYSDYGEFGGF